VSRTFLHAADLHIVSSILSLRLCIDLSLVEQDVRWLDVVVDDSSLLFGGVLFVEVLKRGEHLVHDTTGLALTQTAATLQVHVQIFAVA